MADQDSSPPSSRSHSASSSSNHPPCPKRQRLTPSSSGEVPPTIPNPLPPPSAAATTIPLSSSTPQEPPRPSQPSLPERIILRRHPAPQNRVRYGPPPQEPPPAVANRNPLFSPARQLPRAQNPNAGHRRAIFQPLHLQQRPPAPAIAIPPLGQNPFPRHRQPFVIMADVRERGPPSVIRIRNRADGSERLVEVDTTCVDYHLLTESNEQLMIQPMVASGRIVVPSSSSTPMAPNLQLGTRPLGNPNHDVVPQAENRNVRRDRRPLRQRVSDDPSTSNYQTNVNEPSDLSQPGVDGAPAGDN